MALLFRVILCLWLVVDTSNIATGQPPKVTQSPTQSSREKIASELQQQFLSVIEQASHDRLFDAKKSPAFERWILSDPQKSLPALLGEENGNKLLVSYREDSLDHFASTLQEILQRQLHDVEVVEITNDNLKDFPRNIQTVLSQTTSPAPAWVVVATAKDRLHDLVLGPFLLWEDEPKFLGLLEESFPVETNIDKEIMRLVDLAPSEAIAAFHVKGDHLRTMLRTYMQLPAPSDGPAFDVSELQEALIPEFMNSIESAYFFVVDTGMPTMALLFESQLTPHALLEPATEAIQRKGATIRYGNDNYAEIQLDKTKISVRNLTLENRRWFVLHSDFFPLDSLGSGLKANLRKMLGHRADDPSFGVFEFPELLRNTEDFLPDTVGFWGDLQSKGRMELSFNNPVPLRISTLMADDYSRDVLANILIRKSGTSLYLQTNSLLEEVTAIWKHEELFRQQSDETYSGQILKHQLDLFYDAIKKFMRANSQYPETLHELVDIDVLGNSVPAELMHLSAIGKLGYIRHKAPTRSKRESRILLYSPPDEVQNRFAVLLENGKIVWLTREELEISLYRSTRGEPIQYPIGSQKNITSCTLSDDGKDLFFVYDDELYCWRTQTRQALSLQNLARSDEFYELRELRIRPVEGGFVCQRVEWDGGSKNYHSFVFSDEDPTTIETIESFDSLGQTREDFIHNRIVSEMGTHWLYTDSGKLTLSNRISKEQTELHIASDNDSLRTEARLARVNEADDRVLVIDEEGTIHRWILSSKEMLPSLEHKRPTFWNILALAPNLKWIFSEQSICDADSGNTSPFPFSRSNVRTIAANSSSIAFASDPIRSTDDNTVRVSVRVAAIPSGQILVNLPSWNREVSSLGFDRNGTMLLIGHADGTIVLIDVQSGREIWELDAIQLTKDASIANIERSPVAPESPNLQYNYSTPHSSIGTVVAWKEKAIVRLKEKKVDQQTIPFPATVSAAEGGWLWVGKGWIREKDVMTVEESILYYSNLVQDKPNLVEAWQRLAQCQNAKGRYAAAMQSIEKAIALAPTMSPLLKDYGDIKSNLNEVDNAISAYNQAIAMGHKDELCFIALGRLKMLQGKFSEASSEFQNALQLNASSVQAIYELGNIAAALRNFGEALVLFDKAIELDRACFEAYRKRGLVKSETKDFKNAILDFDVYLMRFPDAGAILNARGVAVLNEVSNEGADYEEVIRSYKEAIRNFDQAIRIAPNYLFYCNRGLAKHGISDLEGAMSDFDQAIRLDSGLPNAYEYRAELKVTLKRWKEALEDYDLALGISPDTSEVIYARGVAKSNLQDFQGALLDFTRVIELTPLHTKAHFQRSQMHKVLRDFENAILDIDVCVKALATIEVYGERSWLRILAEDYEGALSDLNEVLRQSPRDFDATINKSLVKSTAPDEKLRNAEEAIRLALAAKRQENDNPYVLVAMACALALQEDFGSAIKLQEQAMLDADYAKDTNPDGGVSANERIEAWKQKKLWTMPSTRKK